jgi:hypothetical protein
MWLALTILVLFVLAGALLLWHRAGLTPAELQRERERQRFRRPGWHPDPEDERTHYRAH